MPLSPQQRRPAPLAALDKTCRRQPPGAPRTNLNNPEQIRTNPNTAKRPDQIGKPPESPQNTRKKTNPEHPRTPPLSRHSCAGRNHSTHQATRTKHLPKKIHPSPLLGGRLGGGWEAPIVHQRSNRRFRHPCAPPLVIPAPPSRHSCAGRNHSTHQATRTKHLPKKIHPSPLLGGRLGGGWEAPSDHQRSSRRFRHSCAPYLAAKVFAAERYSVKPNRWGNSPVRSRM